MSTSAPDPGSPGLYFFHIPKTSGTSLHRFFTHVLGAGACSPPLLWDHLIEGKYQPPALIQGHLGGAYPLYAHKKLSLFTVLREPAARALSHINHVQRDSAHPHHAIARNLTVRDYCLHPRLRKTIANYQSHYLASLGAAQALGIVPGPPVTSRALAYEESLYATDDEESLKAAAIQALDAFTAVGICERHDETCRLFQKHLHHTGEIPAVKANVAESGQPTLASISPDDLALLRSLNTIDRTVYEAALLRFSKDVDAL